MKAKDNISRCTRGQTDQKTFFGLTSQSPADKVNFVGELDPAICWQALRSRDRRFDGRFFAGAATTKVYCRPTCKIPFAKPSNTLLFASAAAAEAEGYRPCTRCRPQASPGTPAWLGTSAVVSRALRLIWQGGLDETSIEHLANRVGIGSRQLRRLFVEHLGAPPIKIASTHRLHFARNLLDETDLAITSIAMASGFRSIRQFNHALKEKFGHSPTQLRSMLRKLPVSSGGLIVRLPYRQPFEWSRTIELLGALALPRIEIVENDCYMRTVQVGDAEGIIEVRNEQNESRLTARIELSKYAGLMQVAERIRRIFDLGADPKQICDHLSKTRELKCLVELRPGLRVPGVWDGFELLVRMLVQKNVKEKVARTLLDKLISIFGRRLRHGTEGLSHLFPSPKVLSKADLEYIGFSNSLGNKIRWISDLTYRGRFSFDNSISLEETVARVCELSELSNSDAQYIAMRAFGEPDAFPLNDSTLKAIADQCRPWRSYAAMHLVGSAAHF